MCRLLLLIAFEWILFLFYFVSCFVCSALLAMIFKFKLIFLFLSSTTTITSRNRPNKKMFHVYFRSFISRCLWSYFLWIFCTSITIRLLTFYSYALFQWISFVGKNRYLIWCDKFPSISGWTSRWMDTTTFLT